MRAIAGSSGEWSGVQLGCALMPSRRPRHSIRFTVEGDRVKGLAYAEVAADKKDFEYLMVQVFPQRDVITIVDQRAPEKPREVRQSDVMMALSAKVCPAV